jgi:hypothetical protein
MNKKTNCKVLKNQIYFMQTSVCDSLSVLQFNNFIFTLILMIILSRVLLITPFTIKIGSNEWSKAINVKDWMISEWFFFNLKKIVRLIWSPVRLTGRRLYGVWLYYPFHVIYSFIVMLVILFTLLIKILY